MSFHWLEQLGDAANSRLCFFDSVPKGVERKSYCFGFGDPIKAYYPKDAKLYMEPQHQGIRLADFVGNTRGMLIASSAFRRLIEKHCTGVEIEYLPLTIVDHKKRPYSTDHCIVNPLGGYDCADLEASRLSYVSDKEVSFVDKLVLSRKKVEKAPQLFRFDLFPSMYIFGPALSEDIIANKLSNVLLYELEVAPQ